METVVEIKTQATHDAEYRQLDLGTWKPYVVKRFTEGDLIPEGAMFLGLDGGICFYQVPRPKPKSLAVLDKMIQMKLSLMPCFDKVEPQQFDSAIEKILKIEIFTTPEEEAWWWKYRRLEFGITGELFKIEIYGKV